MVLLLWRNLVKEQEGAWRRRIYRKYASCKWLKDAGLEFTRADVVVSISRGPPGQWFPETEHWASAIFVGTSGIPPKIIYRSVKSYQFLSNNENKSSQCASIMKGQKWWYKFMNIKQKILGFHFLMPSYQVY